MVAGRIPWLEAMSRLMVISSRGPAFCWSLATSEMPGMLFSLSRKIDDQ
jgi:hypothetical protein